MGRGRLFFDSANELVELFEVVLVHDFLSTSGGVLAQALLVASVRTLALRLAQEALPLVAQEDDLLLVRSSCAAVAVVAAAAVSRATCVVAHLGEQVGGDLGTYLQGRFTQRYDVLHLLHVGQAVGVEASRVLVANPLVAEEDLSEVLEQTLEFGVGVERA